MNQVWSLQDKVPLHTTPNAFACVNVFDKYTKLRQIGQGTYGEVWLAKVKETDEWVAIKKMKVDGQKERRQGFPVTAIREIRVLKKLQHDNLVLLREVSRSDAYMSNGFKGSVYLTFEYAEHDLCGLHERLRRNPSGAENIMPAGMTKRFLRQLMSALAYCHSMGVLHRDLKSSNVLITNKGQVKLADFGLARFQPPDDILTYRVCTLWYRPPELLLGGTTYRGEVDVWSAGCIFFEMLTGKPLFTGERESAMILSIKQLLGPLDWVETRVETSTGSFTYPAANTLKHHKMATKHVDCMALDEHTRRASSKQPASEHAIDLLRMMLSPDPAKRPSAQACLSHPYFTDPAEDPEMTEAEFVQRTDGLSSCHEYSIKQSTRKRSRREGDAGGMNNTPEGSTAPSTKSAHSNATRVVDPSSGGT